MPSIADIRREKARQLARDAGGQAEFARKVGYSDSRVSQLLGTNFIRNIGNRSAHEIERAFGKEDGWLSLPDVAENTTNTASTNNQPAKEDHFYFIHVHEDLLEIISAWNTATEMGRNAIKAAARAAPRDEAKLRLVKNG